MSNEFFAKEFREEDAMQTGKSLKQVLLLITFALFLTACSSQKNTADYNISGGSTGSSPQEAKNNMQYDSTAAGVTSGTDGGEVSTEEKESTNSVSTNRKLIRRISMELETLEFDSTLALIEKEVTTSGGYVETSEIQGDRYKETGSRYASLVIRIPSTKVDSFINLVDENTNVVNKQESTEDITLDYVDTESHIKTLEIEQERLLALLKKSEKLEDIIALEERLSNVRYELEKYSSTLRTYDNLVDYSTVTLTVNEVVRITPPEGKSAFDRMGSGLKDSFYNIRNGFVNFIVWLVVNVPYIVIWGCFLTILALIGIKVNKKYKKKLLTSVPEKTEAQDSNPPKEPDK